MGEIKDCYIPGWWIILWYTRVVDNPEVYPGVGEVYTTVIPGCGRGVHYCYSRVGELTLCYTRVGELTLCYTRVCERYTTVNTRMCERYTTVYTRVEEINPEGYSRVDEINPEGYSRVSRVIPRVLPGC